MPIDVNNYIASGNPGLFAGPILFRQGRVDTPLLSMISSRRRSTNSEIFVIGQTYSAPVAGDSVISELQYAKDVPPYRGPVGRVQDTNVTQIHAKSIAITDYSQGNRGMLSPENPSIAGLVGNPINELDFQRAQVVDELAQDIEYSLLNGQYHYRNGDRSDANRTRGLIQAIQTNVMDLKGDVMSWNYLNQMLIGMSENGCSTAGLVLFCGPVVATQIAVEAKAQHFEVVRGASNINGIAITDIYTLRGIVRLVDTARYLPDGHALLLNVPALSLVEQPFPNGNFQWFTVGRKGNATEEMLQGAIGLDYGYEGVHGLFTNISNEVPVYRGTQVYMTNNPVPTTEVAASLKGAKLASAQVGVASALELEYTGVPTADPTLTYQWQIGKNSIGVFNDIEGATEATYTPVAETDTGMFIRCVVTAEGTAAGGAVSNSKKVTPAAPVEDGQE